MAARKKNKVKFGLNKVHFAMCHIDDDGNATYDTPVRIPGGVSLSVNPSGEPENFYADNRVYYVINNNSGYEGDLELALLSLEFRKDVLGELLDQKGVLVEKNDAELKQFALLFEFDGDVNHIRHVLYCCTASRTAVEGETNTDTKTPKTETCSFTAAALDNGLVKCRTCEETDSEVYANWYKAVYVPNVTEATGE